MELIQEKRMQIHNWAITKGAWDEKSGVNNPANIFRALFLWYDRLFWDDFFTQNRVMPLFSWSKRLRKSAGNTKRMGQGAHIQYEIQIGTWVMDLLPDQKDCHIGGLYPADALEALQLILEHELCHLFLYVTHQNPSCKQRAFRKLAFETFGHTLSYHNMKPKWALSAKAQNIHLGDMVSFFVGQTLHQGKIIKIDKTACVLCLSKKGKWMDKHKNRYDKYHVPLLNCKKIDLP